jgi:uncharacterized protein YecE (DUF72 family)
MPVKKQQYFCVNVLPMEFGYVPETELDKVDFTLPPDPIFNRNILKGGPVKDPKIYVGCPRWGTKEWVGKIYPLNTKEKDFLQHYVEHFNCIELNATHYKVYDEAATSKWAEKAEGKDFLFCPKMIKEVTHAGNMKDKQIITEEFLQGLKGFGQHLGPIFIQVSDTFSPARKKELFDYLATLPTDQQFFLEVRHPDWFSIEKERDDLFSFLRDQNIGAVITDTAGRRDCAHMYVTVPKTFIRYVGNRMHPTDHPRIDEWVGRIKYWLDNGLKELYLLMHVEDLSPEGTAHIIDVMNKVCGFNLPKPKFVDKPSTGKVVQSKLF